MPARERSSSARSEFASVQLYSAPSPDPTHNVPSGSERTVPIECESLDDGMQSLVFDGGGHGTVASVPRSTSSGPASALLGSTSMRVSRAVFSAIGLAWSVSWV